MLDIGTGTGVLAGAADQRPKTYVLLAAVPELADWFLLGAQPVDQAAYRARMAELAPGRFIAALAPASVFFQFARKDEYVTEAQAHAFFDAAHEPKLMRVYEVDHGMNNRDGVTDRFRWLVKELQLTP